MKNTVNLSIYLVLVLIVWWSITADYSDDNQLEQIRSTQYAEIFMNEFKMTVMGEDGKPGYILQGLSLQRDTGSDDSTIQQPVFQLLQEDRRWKITADQAILNDKKETVQLKNNVVMQQQNVEPAVTIHTKNMLIHTGTQIAQTETLIVLTQGDSRLQSNGMIFNNHTSELTLSSDVTGYFLPHE